MNANEVIECYVNDVALQLPRKLRNDVAFELRELLNEQLQDKADASGRTADPAMAIELLRAYGRPADVAARYLPTLTIIDPADGRAFLRLSVIGLLIWWTLGLSSAFPLPIHSADQFLLALGRWWTSSVVSSLWWPGALVVGFGIAAWKRRQWPESEAWKPVAGDHVKGGRAALVMGMIGIVCGLIALVEPRWVLDLFWGGRAAPAAYDALTYTDAFRHRQGPLLLLLVAINIPMHAVAIVKNRWTAVTRRMQLVLGLATCAVMAWAVADGPIFIRPASDNMTKILLVLIIILTLLDLGIRLHRNVKPSPDRIGPRLTG